MKTDKINLHGEVFEELTVTAKVAGLNDIWLVQCTCGKYLQVKGWMFRKRKLFCCGCLKYPRRKYHPLWKRWYENLSRGVLCESWSNDFDQFVMDVSPYENKMKLARLDTSKPFGPGNYEWVKRLANPNFQNCKKKLTLETDPGQVYLHDWACERGLQPQYARVVILYNRHFVTEEDHMLELIENDRKINSICID